jgi:hypothetical protein
MLSDTCMRAPRPSWTTRLCTTAARRLTDRPHGRHISVTTGSRTREPVVRNQGERAHGTSPPASSATSPSTASPSSTKWCGACWTHPDGPAKRVAYKGELVVRVTNTDTGASYDADASGTAVVDHRTDGSRFWSVLGPVLIGIGENGGNLSRGPYIAAWDEQRPLRASTEVSRPSNGTIARGRGADP